MVVGIDVGEIDSIQKELLKICHFISPHYFPVVEPTKLQDRHIFPQQKAFLSSLVFKALK